MVKRILIIFLSLTFIISASLTLWLYYIETPKKVPTRALQVLLVFPDIDTVKLRKIVM